MKHIYRPRIPFMSMIMWMLVYTLGMAMSLIVFKEWVDFPYDVMMYFRWWQWVSTIFFYALFLEYLFHAVCWFNYRIRRMKKNE